jgi:hypothetical protein
MMRWITIRVLRISALLRREPDRTALRRIAQELEERPRGPPISRRVPGTAADGRR